MAPDSLVRQPVVRLEAMDSAITDLATTHSQALAAKNRILT